MNPSEPVIVAVDGGAAAGKSSTSRAVAEKLDLMHVDTGAHYRTLTHALLAAGTGPDQPDAVAAALRRLELGTELRGRRALLSIGGTAPPDEALRGPEVNAAVSRFAALPAVRDALFHYQRGQAEAARRHGFAGLIMEGRDIGSVIFPDAPFRFFLHADEATRAARRALEGQTDAIAERDKIDRSRKNAPLRRPEGAVAIDTGPLTLEEVVDLICRTIEAGLSQRTDLPAAPGLDGTRFYHGCRKLVELYFSCGYDYSVSGLEHVPRSGGLILAANHVSFYDPPALGAKVPRQIHYFARDTLFKGPLDWLLRRLEVIPVARRAADVASLKLIFKVLKADGAVALFPEGTRSPDERLMPPKPGAGMIACRSGATVVPARIFGTHQTFGRKHTLPRVGGRIHVTYGSPLTTAEIDPGKDHPERYLEASRRIMTRIAELRPPAAGEI